MHFLPSSRDSIAVVPPPMNGSSTQSPFFEYLRIRFRGTSGAQFPRYAASWTAQVPRFSNDQKVVVSPRNAVGWRGRSFRLLAGAGGMPSSASARSITVQLNARPKYHMIFLWL